VCAGGYAKFTGLKTYNKQLKTLLAIGGWNEGSTRFSPLVADEERRTELVRNVVRFLRQNHFDGLDLDWEYPAFRDGGKPRDRENYGLLVQVFRAIASKIVRKFSKRSACSAHLKASSILCEVIPEITPSVCPYIWQRLRSAERSCMQSDT
jgi:GH18 family chitinase